MRFFLDTNYYYDSQYKIDYNKLIYNPLPYKITNTESSFLSKLNLNDLTNVDIYVDPVTLDTTVYIICGKDALKYVAINIENDEIASETIISKTCKKIIITRNSTLNNVLNI